MNLEQIPTELRSRDQWILWRLETNASGKLTKIPYSIHGGRRASTTDPTTWAPYEETADALAMHSAEFSGLGYVFATDDPYVGVDLDHAIENGVPAPWAAAIVKRLDTYCETSPSGTGIHAILEGAIPGGRGRKNGRVEIYSEGRYFTVTGNHVAGTPATINARQAALEKVYRETFAEKEEKPDPEPHGSGLSDDDVIFMCRRAKNGKKFADLWNGEWEKHYGSHSEADCGLCAMLAFFCGPDAKRIGRLFLGSELGKRDKARRPDYLKRTIEKALEGMTEFYSSNGTGPTTEGSAAAKKYTFMSLEDMANLPRPRWLVTGYVPESSLVLIYGPAGSKKTFLAADMALSVASGFPWLEHAVRTGTVRYTAGEGATGFINRVLAWGRNALTTCRDGFAFGPVPQLLDPGSVAGFLGALKEDPPKIVFIDTLSRALVGGDENASSDTGRAVEALDLIRRETGSAIVILHHRGKDASKGARGSTVLTGAADVVLAVEEEKKSGAIKVSTEKMKDAEERKPFTVLADVIPLGQDADGEPVSSLRLRRRTREEAIAASGKASGEIHGLLSKASFREEGLSASDIRSRLRDMPKSTFFDAVDSLIEAGAIEKSGSRYRVPKLEESGSPEESGEPKPDSYPRESSPAGGGPYRGPTGPTDSGPETGSEKDPVRNSPDLPLWVLEDPPAAPRDPADDSRREPGEEEAE